MKLKNILFATATFVLSLTGIAQAQDDITVLNNGQFTVQIDKMINVEGAQPGVIALKSFESHPEELGYLTVFENQDTKLEILLDAVDGVKEPVMCREIVFVKTEKNKYPVPYTAYDFIACRTLEQDMAAIKVIGIEVWYDDNSDF